MWQLWIVFAGVFFIIEMLTVGFLVFWFGIGALLTMVASFFIDNIIIQTTIFLVSSTVLLFFTRPFVNKFSKKDSEVQTNAYSIIGKKGIVKKSIDPLSGTGLVKVGTEVWSAKSFDDSKIEKGLEVEIVEIDGVKVIVK